MYDADDFHLDWGIVLVHFCFPGQGVLHLETNWSGVWWRFLALGKSIKPAKSSGVCSISTWRTGVLV
jgi:hypothetical protein